MLYPIFNIFFGEKYDLYENCRILFSTNKPSQIVKTKRLDFLHPFLVIGVHEFIANVFSSHQSTT